MQRFRCMVVCALWLSGCASAFQMKLPSQGQHWFEAKSTHFDLLTDLDEQAASQLTRDLERRRAALIATAWHGVAFPFFTTRVIALRDTDELGQFAVLSIIGFWSRDTVGQKYLVFPVGRGHQDHFDRGLEVATHELTHELSSYYFARQPRWLGEGLAVYLQGLEINEKKELAIAGRSLPDELGPLFHGLLKTRLEVMEQGHAIATLLSEENYPDEALAGLLVTYLVNTQSSGFDCFLRALFRGEPSDRAWNTCLPTYSSPSGISKLEEDLHAWYLQDEIHYRAVAAPSPPYTVEPAIAPLDEARVRALRASLLLHGPHNVDAKVVAQATADVDTALASDPTQVEALELRVELLDSRAEKLAVARAAVKAKPGEARAWLLIDQAMGDEGSTEEEAERLAALQGAARLDPNSAWTLQRLARSLARSRRPGEGVELVRRALHIDPDNFAAFDTGAYLAIAQGNCPAARALEEMAVERLPPPPKASDAEAIANSRYAAQFAEWDSMRQRLADYRARCPESADAPPPALPAPAPSPK